MNRLDTGGSTNCLHCGTHVTDRFAAVFGDADGRVYRCSGCDSMPRISRGSAAGKDVPEYVDPDDESAFNQGARARARTDGGDAR